MFALHFADDTTLLLSDSNIENLIKFISNNIAEKYIQVIQRRWLGMVAADKAEIRTELNSYLCTSLTSAPPFIRYRYLPIFSILSFCFFYNSVLRSRSRHFQGGSGAEF